MAQIDLEPQLGGHRVVVGDGVEGLPLARRRPLAVAGVEHRRTVLARRQRHQHAAIHAPTRQHHRDLPLSHCCRVLRHTRFPAQYQHAPSS